MSDNEFLGKSIKRSFSLYLAGTIVSIFSYLAFDDMFVKFGIFQFIATSIIISQFLLKNHILQLFWALIVILVLPLIGTFFLLFVPSSNHFLLKSIALHVSCLLYVISLLKPMYI